MNAPLPISSCSKFGLAPILMLCATGCSEQGLAECGHEMRPAVASPDGLWKATLDEVNCGATTSYATWVLVTEKDDEFSVKEDRVAVFDDTLSKLVWKSNDTISVAGAGTLAATDKDWPVIEHEGRQ